MATTFNADLDHELMDRELKWRQYELLVNFTKHGFDLALKAIVLYFAVTGAMLSFYAAQPDPTRIVMRIALMLPFVMGLFFMGASAAHAFSTWRRRAEVKRLAEELRFGSWPDPRALGIWMGVNVVLYGLISAGLALLIF
jgi:hypothetical protein